jgi:hypothetical protein
MTPTSKLDDPDATLCTASHTSVQRIWPSLFGGSAHRQGPDRRFWLGRSSNTEKSGGCGRCTDRASTTRTKRSLAKPAPPDRRALAARTRPKAPAGSPRGSQTDSTRPYKSRDWHPRLAAAAGRCQPRHAPSSAYTHRSMQAGAARPYGHRACRQPRAPRVDHHTPARWRPDPRRPESAPGRPSRGRHPPSSPPTSALIRTTTTGSASGRDSRRNRSATKTGTGGRSGRPPFRTDGATPGPVRGVDGVVPLLLDASSSRPGHTGDVTARSRMEQSVEAARGRSQLVRSGSGRSFAKSRPTERRG